jgi:hypothetical protein
MEGSSAGDVTMTTSIEIIETQDGALYLAVLRDGAPVHLYDGFEYLEPGIMLREILRALAGTEDWDGDSATPAADYQSLSGAKVIATADGRAITVFPRSFGIAGRRFAASAD